MRGPSAAGRNREGMWDLRAERHRALVLRLPMDRAPFPGYEERAERCMTPPLTGTFSMGTSNATDGTGQSPPTDTPALVDAVEAAMEQCPRSPEAPKKPAKNPWHDVLYDRLRDAPIPVLVTDGEMTPAASLWTGSRHWTDSFRRAGLTPGDRIVIALPPSAGFVQSMLAALWEGLTVAVAPPDTDLLPLLEHLDARGVVSTVPSPHGWTPDASGIPQSCPVQLRPRQTGRTPDVRFLVRTSGTEDTARWVALSDRNVLSVLAGHLPHFSLRSARVLSVLPWTHAFGLVLDVLPSLLAGAVIVRDPKGGRDPHHLLDLHDTWAITHMSSVPLTIQRVFEVDGGRKRLRQLRGGIVGGAPVSGPLASRLSDTSLRAGYGQTEASPGIALGPKGRWKPHYLGRPVGCSVDIADDGELRFEGPNACVGVWECGSLRRLDATRTVSTGDLVVRDGEDLYFRGRKGTSFTLSNGRMVHAGRVESEVKTAYPELVDALVFTPNGDDVAVALCPQSPNDSVPSVEALRDELGPLGNRLVWAPTVPVEAWKRQSKGSVDRAAMTNILRTEYRTEHGSTT